MGDKKRFNAPVLLAEYTSQLPVFISERAREPSHRGRGREGNLCRAQLEQAALSHREL